MACDQLIRHGRERRAPAAELLRPPGLSGRRRHWGAASAAGAARRASDLPGSRGLRRAQRKRQHLLPAAVSSRRTAARRASPADARIRARRKRLLLYLRLSIPRETALIEPSMSVLVVDDEPTIGDIVARYLVRAGFEAHVALDGPQAIAMSAEHSPDLVVLDIMLPGIDGLEVMRRLHEGDSPRPAVILLTAKGEESDRIVGVRRGADDYVVQPFSPAQLVARVQAVLRRGAAKGEGQQT